MKEKERSLAHIETIGWVKPIDGADNIELIGVLGWVCIAKIGEFKPGDKAVYIEIDSKCPETDERFSFLASKHYKVKTMKLSKFNCFSQGLALPITLFPEIADKPIGTDVTKELHITYSSIEDQRRKSNGVPDANAKYKAMAARHPKLARKKWFRWLMKKSFGKKILFLFLGKKKDKPKGFPEWIVKTDEARCLTCDAKIQTNNGVKRIGEIVNKKEDVLVKSYNFNTREFEYKKIVDYQKFNPEPLLNIKYMRSLNYSGSLTSRNSQSITCSYDHRLLTTEGYKKAIDITKSDKLLFVNKSISQNAIPYLYGLIIGDGHLVIENRSASLYRITFSQGEKQEDYLYEKLRLLGIKNPCVSINKSGYCDSKIIVAHTPSYETLTRELNIDGAILNNKLFKNKNFCNRLNLISLAFWYLDDGTLRHKDDGLSPTIEFSTHSETEEEVKNLMETLQRFGIESKRNNCYRNSEFIGFSIRLNADDTYNFLEMIKNYIPYCMRYKTIKKFENEPYILEDFEYCYEDILYPVDIIKITEERPKPLYDIEVEDNHNFIANDIINHNCENMPWVLESTEPWIVTEKADGTSCTYCVNKIKKEKYEFIVCSRNVRQVDQNQKCYHDTNIYWDLAFKYNIEDVLTKFAIENNYDKVVIQGEGIGNVQGNPYKLKENILLVFNLVINGVRTGTIEMAKFCKEHGFEHVPIISEEYYLPKTMEEMKLEADGFSEINPNVKREGFVYRSLDGQKSFKNVSREYLLKHNG